VILRLLSRPSVLAPVLCSAVLFTSTTCLFVCLLFVHYFVLFPFIFTPFSFSLFLLAADLEKFDQLCVTLSSWCQEQGVGLKTVPKVKEVVAVRQQKKKSKGEVEEGGEGNETWARAMVSRQVSDTCVRISYLFFG